MMKNQLAGLMKQAQAMQDNLKKAQDELATIEVEGQSGAGLVKVTMTCKHDVKRVAIDPSLLADDKDMLEDLVAAAFNDGVRRAEEVSAGEDGQADRRHAAAARHEVAVLSRSWRMARSRRTSLDGLIEALRRLPGVGVKSAQRMAFHLLQHDRDGARRIARRAAAGGRAACATASAATPSPKTRSAASASTRRATRASCAWSRRRPTRRRSSAPAAIAACTSC